MGWISDEAFVLGFELGAAGLPAVFFFGETPDELDSFYQGVEAGREVSPEAREP